MFRKNKKELLSASLLSAALLISCSGDISSSSISTLTQPSSSSLESSSNLSSSNETSSSSESLITLVESSSNEVSSSESSSSSLEEVDYSYQAKGNFYYPREEINKTFEISGDFKNFSTYDNSTYHEELAELGIVLSTNVYETIETSVEGMEVETKNKKDLFDALGMEDYQMVSLNKEDYQTDSNDTACFQMAHHRYEVNGVSKEAIFLVFCGTRNQEEWLSDMDLGGCEEYGELTGEHPDYKDLKLHKGISVAYERSLPSIEEYLADYISPTKDNALFITGHSRGAGLANLVGAHLEKEGNFKTFTYTFASPRIIRDSETDRDSIFNIVNEQDFVGALAPASYGFKRYGNDIFFNTKDFQASFVEETGNKYAAMDVDALVGTIETIAPEIKNLYQIEKDEDHECFTKMTKGPYESEAKTQAKLDTAIATYLAAYSTDFYTKEVVKSETQKEGSEEKEITYSFKVYDCPALALQSIAFIADNAFDFAAAAMEVIKAMMVLSEPQKDIIAYFVSNSSGLSVNHEMFTYMAGLNHLKSAQLE